MKKRLLIILGTLRWVSPIKIIASVAVGGGIAIATVGTIALFTDTAAVGSNDFTAGTVDISTSPASAVFTVTGMAPGDSSTQELDVSNAGSLALRYALTGSATNADTKGLKDQLVLTIKTIDVTSPATKCNDFDGTQLYIGDMDSTAGVLFGNVTAGAQPGDRTLAAAASETLCVRVDLSSATGNAFQGATTTATFTFEAQQSRKVIHASFGAQGQPLDTHVRSGRARTQSASVHRPDDIWVSDLHRVRRQHGEEYSPGKHYDQ